MTDDVVLRIDGTRSLSGEMVAVVNAACDSAEDRGGHFRLIVQAKGAPVGPWPSDLTVGLVSKWERALRRLECLPVTTVAVADGDCGGLALDALLATDYRIATGSVRLLLPVDAGATWPGMAVYRLAQQGARTTAIRRAVLLGTPVSLADALALHLIDTVTDDEESAMAAAAGLSAAFSGPEVAIRRQLLFEAPTVGFEEALGVHLAACDRALRRASAGAAS